MPLKLYHQVGHNPTWNVESFTIDKCGDGLILSPVHQPKTRVEQLPPSVRAKSIFDPQYYLPNSQKTKLKSYDFFPERIANGFSTIDFHLLALESAKQCVEFQIANGFESLVIPARYVDQMATRYFEDQDEFSVHPFLAAISRLRPEKPIFMTVPVTTAMLRDARFNTQLLNWITGYPEISGVYMLVSDDRSTKQPQATDCLTAQLEFVHELRNANLEVVIGHLNTESILFSVLGDVTLTFGSFENTRMFSIDKFVDSDEERRAPKPRIYLPRLLNWIQFEHAVEIRDDSPSLWQEIYTPTEDADAALASPVEPHFSQPGLYKHHFKCMQSQFEQLRALEVVDRARLVRQWIRDAMAWHEQVSDLPVDLDVHGGASHLQPWLDSLNAYVRRHLRS